MPDLDQENAATMQGTSGAPGTAAAAPTANPSSLDDATMKGWVRANARWLMAELDWTRAGRRADERETLNP